MQPTLWSLSASIPPTSEREKGGLSSNKSCLLRLVKPHKNHLVRAECTYILFLLVSHGVNWKFPQGGYRNKNPQREGHCPSSAPPHCPTPSPPPAAPRRHQPPSRNTSKGKLSHFPNISCQERRPRSLPPCPEPQAPRTLGAHSGKRKLQLPASRFRAEKSVLFSSPRQHR